VLFPTRWWKGRAERQRIRRALSQEPPACPNCGALVLRRDARDYPNYRAPQSAAERLRRERIPEYGYECRACDALYSGRETYFGVVGEYVGPLSSHVPKGWGSVTA